MSRKNEDADFSFRPFSNLKNKISEVKKRPVPAKAALKPQVCEDEELFRAEMKDVREIKEFRGLNTRRWVATPIPKLRDSESQAMKTLEEISKGRRPIRLSDTQEYVEWVNPAYGSAVIAGKLHEGHFAVQDFLDLHGYTADEAEDIVSDFMKTSLLKGLRCVKIIHGRGLKSPNGPVLKISLVRWLSSRFRKNVIAFVTARQCDGGLGALYVLLKQRRSGS